MEKTKFQTMIDAIADWAEEDNEGRCAFCIFGDEKKEHSSCAIVGNGQNIVGAIANERYSDEDTRQILNTTVKLYDETVKKLNEEEKKQAKTKTPKRMLS